MKKQLPPRAVAVDPGEVVVEQPPQPGLAARLPERRHDDLLDEVVDRPLQHLDLQRLLGLEVREQAALRQVHPRRQHAERQPLKADLAGQRPRPLDDLLLWSARPCSG